MGANAQTTVPTFTAGQTLTAAQVNQINTGVPVASGTATRDALFGGSGEKTLAEGQLVYVEGLGLQSYNSAGAWVTWGTAPSLILQVVSTAKTDTFSTTSMTYTDITGLSASITPSATSSLVLVEVNMVSAFSTDMSATYQIVRGSTAIGIGAAAGSRTQCTFGVNNGAANAFGSSMTFLDTPSTTSATTYKMQGRTNTGTIYVNRTAGDTDSVNNWRSISTITLYEVRA